MTAGPPLAILGLAMNSLQPARNRLVPLTALFAGLVTIANLGAQSSTSLGAPSSLGRTIDQLSRVFERLMMKNTRGPTQIAVFSGSPFICFTPTTCSPAMRLMEPPALALTYFSSHAFPMPGRLAIPCTSTLHSDTRS